MSQLTVHKGDISVVWPMLLDYSRPECFQILRRLELEAYAKVVAVFRAQGPLTGEKRKILYKLQRLLSISTDRHKAEVRRVLNDEELATISEATCGKLVNDDWIVEGKRVAPILHRPSPKTAYLFEANRAALDQLCENYALPPPCETAFLNLAPHHAPSECRSSSPAKEGTVSKEFSNKSTQTITHSPEPSPIEVADVESRDAAEGIPRVDYEVTCETESSHMPAELVNGHMKQRSPFVIESQNSMIRGNHEIFDNPAESGPNRQFGSDGDSGRVSLSAQLNSAHGALLTELQPFGKLYDTVQGPVYKSGTTETSSLGHNYSRKRSLSNSPGATTTTGSEHLAPPSKLLSLVHAPSTLATPTRRPAPAHLVQPSLGTETSLTSSSTTGPFVRGSESAQPVYPSVQRVQTTKAVHGMHVGLPCASSNRPHSQLVLQMCRTASETQPASDPTMCTARSGSSVIIPSRAGSANTALRNHPGPQASSANFSFKSPLIGSRIQRHGPMSPASHSLTADPGADYAHRIHSTTATTTSAGISMVQSLPGVTGSHRLPSTVNTIVLSSSGSEVSRPTLSVSHASTHTLVSQPPKPTPAPLVNISTNHLTPNLSTTPASTVSTDLTTANQPLAARRLVSSAQPLIVPGLQVSSAPSIVQNTTSAVSNSNVIVFQRGGRKPCGLGSSSIKLTPMASGIGQSISSPATSVAAGNRQIRILGLPSAAFSASTTGTTPVLTTVASSVTTVAVTSTTRPPQFTSSPSTLADSVPHSIPTESERTTSDAIGSLLSRASRLGAMLEVDLDADDYPTQTPVTTDAATGAGQHLTTPAPSAGPLLQSVLTQSNEVRVRPSDSCPSSVILASQSLTTDSEAGTLVGNRSSAARLHVDSNAPSSSIDSEAHAPTDPHMDERNCPDTPIEVPTSGKIDQLKAILGLTTHGSAESSVVETGIEPPLRSVAGATRVNLVSTEQTSCSTSTSDHWMFDRAGSIGCSAPEPKRTRLSPSVADQMDLIGTSPPGGRQLSRPLQHQLDQGALSVEPNPD